MLVVLLLLSKIPAKRKAIVKRIEEILEYMVLLQVLDLWAKVLCVLWRSDSFNVVSVWSLEVVVCDMIHIMRPLMRRIRPIEMMIIYSHTNTTIGNTIRSLTMETTKRAMSGGEFVHNTRQLNAWDIENNKIYRWHDIAKCLPYSTILLYSQAISELAQEALKFS